MYIAMKQITDRGGYPFVFLLDRAGDELLLKARYAEPAEGWRSGGHFVFLLRKRDLETK